MYELRNERRKKRGSAVSDMLDVHIVNVTSYGILGDKNKIGVRGGGSERRRIFFSKMREVVCVCSTLSLSLCTYSRV
jgi:hypothetical protein